MKKAQNRLTYNHHDRIARRTQSLNLMGESLPYEQVHIRTVFSHLHLMHLVQVSATHNLLLQPKPHVRGSRVCNSSVPCRLRFRDPSLGM